MKLYRPALFRFDASTYVIIPAQGKKYSNVDYCILLMGFFK